MKSVLLAAWLVNWVHPAQPLTSYETWGFSLDRTVSKRTAVVVLTPTGWHQVGTLTTSGTPLTLTTQPGANGLFYRLVLVAPREP